MKCVCGHEQEEEFKVIHRIPILNIGRDTQAEVKITHSTKSIYACPKCGTLKVEVNP